MKIQAGVLVRGAERRRRKSKVWPQLTLIINVNR
jgi:hypothetical protein